MLRCQVSPPPARGGASAQLSEEGLPDGAGEGQDGAGRTLAVAYSNSFQTEI